MGQICIEKATGKVIEWARQGRPATYDALKHTLLTATDSAPSASAAPGFTYLSSNTGLATWGTGPVRIRTNTSAAIRSRLSASDVNTVFYIRTLGWLDDMGQDY